MGPLYPGSTFRYMLYLSLDATLGTNGTTMNGRLRHIELLKFITSGTISSAAVWG